MSRPTKPAEGTPGLGPATRRLLDAVVATWPEHRTYLRKSFGDRPANVARTAERVAQLILTIAEARGLALESFVEDYRFMVEELIYPEELFFRREGRYRLSTFEEADRLVYSDQRVMSSYMNGILVSDCLWVNHAKACTHYCESYLARWPRGGGEHLEIGPGHGFLVSLAICSGRFQRLNAWDVSSTAIAHTRQMLEIQGQTERVELLHGNLLERAADASNSGRFEAVVLSEVLEHLECPGDALAAIRGLLAPGGTIWINVPANAPMTDHIFHLRSLQEALTLVAEAGLEVLETAAFPAADEPLPRAVKADLPVTYVLIARRR